MSELGERSVFGARKDLAEDMADSLDAEAARTELLETAAEPIPWEQVQADLGLA